MKTGEYWKLGTGLWVCITRTQGSSAHFRVVNGAWEGRYDADKKQVYVKYTKAYIPVETISGPMSSEEARSECGY